MSFTEQTNPADLLDEQIPVGVHPSDAATPFVPGFDANRPVPGDVPQTGKQPTRRKPWSTENENAMPVYQRAARDWTAGLVSVLASDEPVQVVGRQPGRVSLKLWVPSMVVVNGVLTATPAGVVFGSEPAEVFSPAGMPPILNVGDAATIEAEASVYVYLIPGQAAGYCQWLSLTNPIGGQLGIY